MSFLNFQFSPPSGEEIEAVKMLAKSDPMELDGREMWILQNFTESDSE